MNNYAAPEPKGVSIVVSANSFVSAGNILENYQRQNCASKELIIIVKDDPGNLHQWLDKFRSIPMVRIYQLDRNKPKSDCLNYGAERSILDYVVFMEEDHFYPPDYLSGLFTLSGEQ